MCYHHFYCRCMTSWNPLLHEQAMLRSMWDSKGCYPFFVTSHIIQPVHMDKIWLTTWNGEYPHLHFQCFNQTKKTQSGSPDFARQKPPQKSPHAAARRSWQRAPHELFVATGLHPCCPLVWHRHPRPHASQLLLIWDVLDLCLNKWWTRGRGRRNNKKTRKKYGFGGQTYS